MKKNKAIQDPEQIRLNEQDELQQVLGHPPGWMLRWGITLVLVAVALFVFIAQMVRYPDIVQAPVVLTTENPPIRLMARAEGRISRLLVGDKEEVQKDQLLGEIENTTDFKEATLLEEALEPLIQNKSVYELNKAFLPDLYALGNLQEAYSELKTALNNAQHFLRQNDVAKKIASLSKQISHLEDLNKFVGQQTLTLTAEVELAQKSYEKFKELYDNGASSELELENAQKEYLAYKRELEKQQSERINNQLEVDRLELQILEWSQEDKEERNHLLTQFTASARKTISEIESWKQTYLFFAPIAGKVSLATIWSSKQHVNVGQQILTIVPEERSGKIIALANLPASRSGKVEKGMPARIRLDAYPYKEFGVLEGEVGRIALAPGQIDATPVFYRLHIELPDQMLTTYDTILIFRQEMSGTAQVVTENRSLLSRVFDRFKHLKNNI